MDKTFAESQGQAPFDWNKWLDAAAANPESITHRDWCAKQALAQRWVTCACGNQCAIIARDMEGDSPGMPIDEELRRLGTDFYHEVFNKRYNHAKLTLRSIERRATVLVEAELALRSLGLPSHHDSAR